MGKGRAKNHFAWEQKVLAPAYVHTYIGGAGNVVSGKQR